MNYEELLGEVCRHNTYENCLSLYINPFSLYYLCDHYYGDELVVERMPAAVGRHKHDLLKSGDLTKIKFGDIVHCQVNYFEKFCREILDKIDQKFILTTGQHDLPKIFKSEWTEKALNHRNIVLWFAQNPIYDNSEKYVAFPYGMKPSNLQYYSNCLREDQNPAKPRDLVCLPVNITNDCRKKLLNQPNLLPWDFFKKMSEAKFILSPIGDRDDCFRHYEAIGLGTIPVSNVHPFYKNIFTTNMIYATIDEMVEMIGGKNESALPDSLIYREPNRDLICYQYHKNITMKLIAERLAKQQ
jgi:hypothetical protein